MNRRIPNGTYGGVEGGLITRPSDPSTQANIQRQISLLPCMQSVPPVAVHFAIYDDIVICLMLLHI